MEQLYPSQSQPACNPNLCVARDRVKVQSRRKYVFTDQIDQLIRESYHNRRDEKTRLNIRPLAKKVGMLSGDARFAVYCLFFYLLRSVVNEVAVLHQLADQGIDLRKLIGACRPRSR